LSTRSIETPNGVECLLSSSDSGVDVFSSTLGDLGDDLASGLEEDQPMGFPIFSTENILGLMTLWVVIDAISHQKNKEFIDTYSMVVLSPPSTNLPSMNRPVGNETFPLYEGVLNS
jgi:hypothetical protein